MDTLLTHDKTVQRSALALNNKGVSLLNQGQFRLARKALNSSLALLAPLLQPNTGTGESSSNNDSRPLLSDNNSPLPQQQPQPQTEQPKAQESKTRQLRKREQNLSDSLKRKRRRLAAKRHIIVSSNDEKPSATATTMTTAPPSTTPALSDNTTADAVLPFDIHVMEDSDLSSMRYSLQYGCSHSVFFAIILRDELDEHQEQLGHSPLSTSDLSRQQAIILYNRAVACILCYEQQRLRSGGRELLNKSSSSSPSSSGRAQHLLRLARKSLHQADSVLSRASRTILRVNHQEQQQGQGQLVDCWTRVQFMLVSGLVLNFISFLYLECQKPTQAHMALQAVDNLSTVLDQYPTMVFDPSQASPAA